MINVLSKILGRKKSGGNDSGSNGSNMSCSKSKEGQTIWQKATSLRQSLRYSSRSKVAAKPNFDYITVSNVNRAATLGAASSPENPLDPTRRDWRSQRNLARERRSLASKQPTTDEFAPVTRSLHSRSVCMSSDWDVDAVAAPKYQEESPLDQKSRSSRKLTKDSGYETSPQADHEYANSITEWFSEEKALNQLGKPRPWPKDNPIQDSQNAANGEHRLEWNNQNCSSNFSHQDVATERARNRQLRHSYSQREVSRHSHQGSVDSLATSSIDITKHYATSVESVNNWPNCPVAAAKSTPHLAQGRPQRLSTSSTGNLSHSESDEAKVGSMVTRRFKKGSVYDTLASKSGLDFSPIVQLKTYSRRDDGSLPSEGTKPSDKLWESSARFIRNASKEKEPELKRDTPEALEASKSVNSKLPSQENQTKFLPAPKPEGNDSAKSISSHEKYPSWPVAPSSASSGTQRSHSWTGHTDYPKEKVAYTRPKKANQYKIATNQLQPVLERAVECNNLNKNSPENYCPERTSESENYNVEYPPCSTSECNSKQFDFEAFHTPCIPQCYEEKAYNIHSPPEHDVPSASSTGRPSDKVPSTESNNFVGRYEDVLRNQAQYSVPLSSNWSKQRSSDGKVSAAGPDTPFLDRLRMENAWQIPPPPVPMLPPNGAAAAPVAAAQPQVQLQQPGNDFELSSENGTWMGSMESSSHGRELPKWQGSYSDLSTLSTQLSNRSSLFDSGHSTMPESGRLSPQSSCDSTAPSLLLEGPTRAQVVARHGCHREIVAHSARVQQPERHGSESVLYYATGNSSRMNGEQKSSAKKSESNAPGTMKRASEEGLYRSHASVTLSPSHVKPNSHELPDCQSNHKFPSRQDSRKSSNSFSSDDSLPRARSQNGDDTFSSSSDISNITCISNYKTNAKSKSLSDSSSPRNLAKAGKSENSSVKYQNGYEQSKSASMDDSSRKMMFLKPDKKQRVSDPELKAFQKQAVMSFYQRMSLAESIKQEKKASNQFNESDAPPPYEATPVRKNSYSPKLSLPNKVSKQVDHRNFDILPSQNFKPLPRPNDAGLQNHHSKSVPNLMNLKGQCVDASRTHPMYNQNYNGAPRPFMNANYSGNNQYGNNPQVQKKRGSPLAKDEVIPWDQLPNVLKEKREAIERAAFSSENSKDPSEDNGNFSSGMHYFKSHKSPRKVQLKEVHHSNETASVKVMTPDGVTLVQAHEQRREDKVPPPPQKRRPAPPPPPKQPPKRPPPPPPPVTPPPQVVVVANGNETENAETKTESCSRHDAKNQLQCCASSPQLCSSASPPWCLATDEMPLPPPPQDKGTQITTSSEEPLPPPPEPGDVDLQTRVLDSSSLIYPKNSYMSYRSEKKIGRQGFDGKYRRSFHTSASSVDLTTLGTSFQDGKDVHSPNGWEQKHNIRQHGTTVVFHSDCLQSENTLQKTNSQNCVSAEEQKPKETTDISCCDSSQSQSNHSYNSITDNQGNQTQSVPYATASHEKSVSESRDPALEPHPIDTKAPSPQNSDNESICETTTTEDCSAVDNGVLTDESFAENEADGNTFTDVDHNQNAIKSHSTENAAKTVNGKEPNRTSFINQTSDTSRLQKKHSKTKEEIECETLSLEYFNHCEESLSLKNLLIPTPNHKTISDYMEGLLNLELESTRHPVQRIRCSNGPRNNENRQREENEATNGKTSQNKSKAQADNAEVNDNQNVVDEEAKKKEELIQSIEKKIGTFRHEQSNIKAEMLQNELLGQEIASRLERVAKRNELEKYTLHVEEMEKIVNLLLSLSGRLAKAENMLRNIPKENTSEEKKILEAKRGKLMEQHEDARRLKESIDRRSNQISTFLRRYLTEEEYAEYDRFIKMKTKLIVDIREIDEKINLGEEQLAALTVAEHLWKSANS